ncbi:nucleotide-diphospho-sugar transferase [Microthyrium microscopicum]|uniref:Nucleotide-diphospho-sugar transferase n=1 Tax=Microthyrium microscopicum TaxID=703497 RepID=A0A6A6UCN4_9PEZI|nr:nucleotide-diphospho-sugar transferase [Microthyrium microscopicum]
MCAKFSGWRPSLRLAGDNVPTVDVFITYCGEGLDVLLDTVHASCALDYPRESFHIYILDDHGFDGVRDALKDVQEKFSNLHYGCRGEKVTTHSKAANLNFGVEYSEKQSASEFLAVLDVDMIPNQNWLRAMLPHILNDDHVALANPPQDFYNIPKNDILGGSFEFRWLSDVFMPMQDCAGKAWCTGSGFVVRRRAIADIQGFPTATLAEDVLTSTLLSGKGWRVVHVHEVLQWGLAPTGLGGILKQRQRMAAGIVSVALLGRSSKGREIGNGQKADNMAIAVIYSFAAIVIASSSISIPILMAAGSQLIQFKTHTQLLICFWLGSFDCVCQLFYGIVESSLSDYRLPILNRFKGLWSVPHRLLSVFQALYRDGDTKFKPTGLSLRSEEILYTSALRKRLNYVFLECYLFGHFVILLACLLGAWKTFQPLTRISFSKSSSQAVWTELMLQAGWPPLLLFWTSVLANAWVPLYYGIAPPKPILRQSLLKHCPKSNALVPTETAKENDEQPVTQWQGLWVGLWVVMGGAWCIVL